VNTADIRKLCDDVNEMWSEWQTHHDGWFYGPGLSPDVVRVLADVADAAKNLTQTWDEDEDPGYPAVKLDRLDEVDEALRAALVRLEAL